MKPAATSTLRNPASHPEKLAWKQRSWGQWLYAVRFQTIGIATVSLIFVGVLYFQAMAVEGTELNVRTWEIREFYCLQEPFTNYQVSGITHAPTQDQFWSEVVGQLSSAPSSNIAIHLKASEMEDRWDLVRIQRGSMPPANGKASILVNMLHAQDSKHGQYWASWTADNPVKAGYLWPAAQDLVRFELYAKLPYLFELAELENDDQEFQSSINQRVQMIYVEYCDRLLDLGNQELAKSVAKVGLSYGANAELQKY